MSRQPLLALALMRVVIGAVFAAHGVQAIFVKGLGHMTAQFQGWNVPLPLLTAPLVATLELAGGVLLLLGLGTRPLALLLAGVMAAAIYFAHWGRAFFGVNGMEVALLLGSGALALALGGPGEPAFDGWVRRGRSSPPAASRPARPSGNRAKN